MYLLYLITEFLLLTDRMVGPKSPPKVVNFSDLNKVEINKLWVVKQLIPSALKKITVYKTNDL